MKRNFYLIGTLCQRVNPEDREGALETSYSTSYEYEESANDARQIVELRIRETHPHQENWNVAHTISQIPDEYLLAVARAIQGEPWIDPTVSPD